MGESDMQPNLCNPTWYSGRSQRINGYQPVEELRLFVWLAVSAMTARVEISADRAGGEEGW